MNRKALNWLLFGGGALIVIVVAFLTLPKLIADQMYEIDPELLAKFEYCKQRYDLVIDDALLLAVAKQESGGRMDMAVVSYAGAEGPMQVMPATAAGLRNKYEMGDLDRLTQNICQGTLYLAGAMARYDGDPHQKEKALAAYNGGPGAAAGYDSGNMPNQTKGYVARIMGVYYPAYQQRLAGTGGKEFAEGQKKVSYFEQIMGAVVGSYVTDKNLTDTSKISQEKTPIERTIEFFSQPFYVGI